MGTHQSPEVPWQFAGQKLCRIRPMHAQWNIIDGWMKADGRALSLFFFLSLSLSLFV